MKKLILSTIVMALMVASCNKKNKDATTSATPMNNDSTMMGNNSKMMNSDSKVYSCPMHPEVHGKLNDKCPKCGMKLTEEVK
ncbi:heavy metal-binding domain-containing protein [Flavobacterium psychrotolerans]|uniref:Heavy metal binding domain-containing protein n=1 Tax=Flavobacterium psychrotolerans TaxID=2169410 RepID=A0A2U1JLR9_9FLAO|nr:heavy metal-binding domain-containing protein [Flavobacterium psychrotolerans]PWA05808.1 hypothetical protein DB895_05120 [Flavobacterium psychrotolerans]